MAANKHVLIDNLPLPVNSLNNVGMIWSEATTNIAKTGIVARPHPNCNATVRLA